MKKNENYIFRYRSGSELSLKELMNGELFFAGNKELNDPTEAKPLYVFAGNPELWHKFVYSILYEAKIYLSEIYKGENFNTNLDKLIQNSEIISKNLNKRKNNYKINQFNISKYFIEEIIKLKSFKNRNKQNVFIRIIDEIIKNTILKHLNENTQYIVSFSKSANNPTMWGHYGNAYKGFCLIFQPEDNNIIIKSTFKEFVNTSKEGIFTQFLHEDVTKTPILEVAYSSKIPKINAFNVISNQFYYSEQEDYYDVPANICTGILNYNEKKFGLFKYKDWKYEQEVRCLIPFKNSRNIKNDNEIARSDYDINYIPENRIYLYKPSHLTGVIIGSNTNKNLVQRIIESIRIMRSKNIQHFNIRNDELSPVFIFQATSSVYEYLLNIKPYGVILGNSDFLSYGLITDNNIKEEIDRISKECNKN